MGKKRPKIEIKLSPSKISCYQQCPRKYYYNYVERLPQLKWPHTLKGNLAHDVLERWVKKGIMKGKEPASAMKEAFEFMRKGKYKAAPEKVIEEVVPWLRGAVRNFKEEKFAPIVAEQFIHFTYRGIMLRGRLDRIDTIDDNTIEVVDYKSSKDPKWLTAGQLGFYHIAVRYGNLSPAYGDKDVKASYILLRHDMKKKPYMFEPKDLDKLLTGMEEVAHKIMTETRWDPKRSRLCNTCDFFVPCTRDTGEWWDTDTEN